MCGWINDFVVESMYNIARYQSADSLIKANKLILMCICILYDPLNSRWRSDSRQRLHRRDENHDDDHQEADDGNDAGQSPQSAGSGDETAAIGAIERRRNVGDGSASDAVGLRQEVIERAAVWSINPNIDAFGCSC